MDLLDTNRQGDPGPIQVMKGAVPPLNSLRAFEAAARHESFLSAATELHVSPGAISRHIKLLEAFLDTTLFDRRSNGVVLTRDGRRYASKVTKIFRDLSAATTEIKRHGNRHRLTISTLPVFSDRWLNQRLPAFLQRCPSMSLQIEFHDGIQGLLVGDVDAWVLYSDGNHPGCSVTRLFDEVLVPVCSPKLRRTLPAHPTAEQVARLPLLHDIYWGEDWSIWGEAMGLVGVDLSFGSRFALYSGVMQAAVDGMGVALGHSAMIGDELESGRLAAINGLGFSSPQAYHLVMTPSASRTRRARELKDWMVFECRGK